MKKIFTILITVIITSGALAQYSSATQKMSYQAIIRNSSNALVQNSPVGIKISILETSITGPAVYIETHTAQTNQNGLLDLQIGGGTTILGTFRNGIYWGRPYFLKTEIDPLGGTNYTITSTSELLSVPVSNFAHVSGALHGPSWNFVGAYTQVNLAFTDFQTEGYSFINYLGLDKVNWTLHFPTVDYNKNDTLEAGEYGYEVTLYGTVFGNVVTFPTQKYYDSIFPECIGTLIGKNLTMRFAVQPDVVALELVKE